ncbi:hypothetical protein TcG_06339 [Trypanosoma cruzi]|nr:hypothetical protein TcG_06339 [Trypanosoma cruzi]
MFQAATSRAADTPWRCCTDLRCLEVKASFFPCESWTTNRAGGCLASFFSSLFFWAAIPFQFIDAEREMGKGNLCLLGNRLFMMATEDGGLSWACIFGTCSFLFCRTALLPLCRVGWCGCIPLDFLEGL